MRELEEKFAEWRAQANAALPGQPETVRELEEHLREHVDRSIAGGAAGSSAFAAAVHQLGELRPLAKEFQRAGALGLRAPGSREFRVVAYGAGVFAIAGLLWHLPFMGRVGEDLVAGRRTVPSASFSFSVLFAIAALCVTVLKMTSRFLAQPNVAGARGIAAFTLLAMWFLSAYFVFGRTLEYYEVKVAILGVEWVPLAALWWRWSNAFERSTRAHA